MSTATDNPNATVNGWCPECKEWAVRGRSDQCMFCDTDLTDGPDQEQPERNGNRFRKGWTDEAIIDAARRWQAATGEAPAKPDWNPTKLQQRADSASERRAAVLAKLALYKTGDFPNEHTARQRFGSMNALNVIAFTDFEPRASGRQALTDRPRRAPRYDLPTLWARVEELHDQPDRKADARAAMYELAEALIRTADRLPNGAQS